MHHISKQTSKFLTMRNINALAGNGNASFNSPDRVGGYIRGFKAFKTASGNDEVLARAISEVCNPELGETVLDIGTADGSLVAQMVGRSASVTYFEPLPELYRAAYENLSAACSSVEGFNDNFTPDVDLGSRQYSLILLSHVLYHVPYQTWTQFFSVLRKILAPSGTIVATLWSKQSEAFSFAQELTPDRPLPAADHLLELATTQDFMKKAGCELVGKRDVTVRIQAKPSHEANAVLCFLSGRCFKAIAQNPRQHARARWRIQQGLNNHQTIMTFKPSLAKDTCERRGGGWMDRRWRRSPK